MYDKKLYFGLEFRDNHLRCLAVGDMKPDGFDLCVTDGGCRLSFASYDIGVLQTSVARDIVNSKIRMQL